MASPDDDMAVDGAPPSPGKEKKDAGLKSQSPGKEEKKNAGVKSRSPGKEEKKNAGVKSRSPGKEEKKNAGVKSQSPGKEEKNAGVKSQSPAKEEKKNAGLKSQSPGKEEKNAGDGGTARPPRKEEKKHMIHTKQCLMFAKEKLPSEKYDKFVKTMTEMWKQSADPDGEIRNICSENGIETVMKLFHGQPQVKQAFLNFTKGRSPLENTADAVQLQKPLDFLRRVRRCPGISKDDYNVLVKTMLQFSQTMTLTAEDVYYKVEQCLMNCPELLEEFIQNYLPPALAVLLSDEQSCKTHKTSRMCKKTGTCSELVAEEYEGDKIEPLPDSRDKELPPKVNLSICKRPTPSYCQLPENCITLQSSYQTELGRSVLNHDFVSVTSGREDQDHCKQKQTQNGADGDQDRKPGVNNKYESEIFTAENDMFESDVLLERFRATADFIATLRDRASSDMKILDHLTPLHRRCIERLYDNYGLNMLDALLESQNVTTALDILLSRLNQKVKDLSEARSSLYKTCSEVIAENYYRSLDHRSSSFRQWDIKRMSHKALLTESKEINKKNLNAGDYIDPDMHEDISSIISYAWASEDTQMMTWTKLVQPVLSVNCLWPDLKETVVPKEACEHCGISKDFLSSMADDLSTDKLPISSKSGELPKNKSNECSSSLKTEIEEGEFIPDAENIHSDALRSSETNNPGPSTCDPGNEPEEQHESKQDPKKSVKPRGMKGEPCCSLVVLRRLYQILYDRLQVAKSLSRAGDKRLSGDSCTPHLYAVFKEKLRRLLDRSIDHCNFENFCLKFLGTESFELFTLDRLINRVTKQLSVIASSDQDNTFLQFLEKLRRPTLPKNLSPHQNAQSDLEKKIKIRKSPTQQSNRLLKQDQYEKVSNPHSVSGKPMQNHFHFQRRKRSKLERGAASLSEPGVKNSNS